MTGFWSLRKGNKPECISGFRSVSDASPGFANFSNWSWKVDELDSSKDLTSDWVWDWTLVMCSGPSTPEMKWWTNWWICPRIEPMHCSLWGCPHLNYNSSPNLFRNQKIGFCGRIHTKFVWEFVDELIRLWCGWAFLLVSEEAQVKSPIHVSVLPFLLVSPFLTLSDLWVQAELRAKFKTLSLWMQMSGAGAPTLRENLLWRKSRSNVQRRVGQNWYGFLVNSLKWSRNYDKGLWPVLTEFVHLFWRVPVT